MLLVNKVIVINANSRSSTIYEINLCKYQIITVIKFSIGIRTSQLWTRKRKGKVRAIPWRYDERLWTNESVSCIESIRIFQLKGEKTPN